MPVSELYQYFKLFTAFKTSPVFYIKTRNFIHILKSSYVFGLYSYFQNLGFDELKLNFTFKNVKHDIELLSSNMQTHQLKAAKLIYILKPFICRRKYTTGFNIRHIRRNFYSVCFVHRYDITIRTGNCVYHCVFLL